MRNESLISMGRRIQSIRKEMNVNQEDMANTLGISTGYMSEIERGKANPTADLLFKLVEKYHINIVFLFHGKGEKISHQETDNDNPEFSVDSVVDSKEKLIRLMDISTFVKHTILGYTSKIVFENKDLIKTDIKMSKNKE